MLSHIWHGDEKKALCHVLINDDQRRWDIFEQAGLIKELLSRHQLSQRELSRLLAHFFLDMLVKNRILDFFDGITLN